MIKKHIRSYSVVAEGDLEVVAWKGDKKTVLSPHYAAVTRDRRNLDPGATLDVFRYENGDIGWTMSVDGHDVASAESGELLLRCFIDDAAGKGGEARAF